MDIARIFALGMKGVGFIQTLAQSGKDITPAVVALKNIFSKRPEDVTEKDLDETEARLDAMLDEFETPMKKLG